MEHLLSWRIRKSSSLLPSLEPAPHEVHGWGFKDSVQCSRRTRKFDKIWWPSTVVTPLWSLYKSHPYPICTFSLFFFSQSMFSYDNFSNNVKVTSGSDRLNLIVKVTNRKTFVKSICGLLLIFIYLFW